MMICEFCSQYQDGKCGLGLAIPKRMGCREFAPDIKGFCSNPKDFVSPSQIMQMAAFFGFKGAEIKKVKLMAEREESIRSETPAVGIADHRVRR